MEAVVAIICVLAVAAALFGLDPFRRDTWTDRGGDK